MGLWVLVLGAIPSLTLIFEDNLSCLTRSPTLGGQYTYLVSQEISEVFAASGKDELVRLEDLGLSDEVYVCQKIFLKHKQNNITHYYNSLGPTTNNHNM